MQNQTVNTVSVSDNTLEQQDKKASDYSDYKFELGVFTKITKPESTVEEISTENTATMPTLPVSEAASDTEALLYRLRHFHLGNPDAITETVGDDYVPALLHAYRNGSNVRYDYPLFLYPAESIEANAEQLAKPISLVLLEWVESFAPNADAARILKDNLHRIERELRQKAQRNRRTH